jgi:hypothetical protein
VLDKTTEHGHGRTAKHVLKATDAPDENASITGPFMDFG